MNNPVSGCFKTGPDLLVAGADGPLCLRAAGAEAADGGAAGESRQGEGGAERQLGQRGDTRGPGRTGAGLSGDAEWSAAVCGCGRQADRAAGDPDEGEAEAEVSETIR